MGDEALASRAAAGNKDAFAALYERYHGPLLGYCRSILLNDEDASDATQNALENALRALPRREPGRPLRPWLYRIAHNEAINIVRRRQPVADGALDTESLLTVPGPEVDAEQRTRLAQLVDDLRMLPERQRGALVMRELSGLSYDEIGVALGVSNEAARRAVFDARTALHDAVDGRATACTSVRRTLSDGDRRHLRARGMRAHLRSCDDCATFERIDGHAPGRPARARLVARRLRRAGPDRHRRWRRRQRDRRGRQQRRRRRCGRRRPVGRPACRRQGPCRRGRRRDDAARPPSRSRRSSHPTPPPRRPSRPRRRERSRRPPPPRGHPNFSSAPQRRPPRRVAPGVRAAARRSAATRVQSHGGGASSATVGRGAAQPRPTTPVPAAAAPVAHAPAVTAQPATGTDSAPVATKTPEQIAAESLQRIRDKIDAAFSNAQTVADSGVAGRARDRELDRPEHDRPSASRRSSGSSGRSG